jgi:hypothetical protein
MTRILLLACAALTLLGAAPKAGDVDAQTAPLLKSAETDATSGDWAAAAEELRTARELTAEAVGPIDPRTLHADMLLVQALTNAGQYEQAIAAGLEPLHVYSAPATKAHVDGLYLRYYMAAAFTNCRAKRCGDEAHRMRNVDALMEALLSGLSIYPKGDQRVASLRTSFAQTCKARYLPEDCAAADGK